MDAADGFGNTALVWAARNNHKDVVKLLIGAGAQLENVKELGVPEG